ncbi:MAG: HlyD family type I secretion periplasmic adaptor subunit [Alphaproteobacteria bacterium]
MTSLENFQTKHDDQHHDVIRHDPSEFGSYRISLVLASICLITFLLWSAFATINLHVRGIGKIIPSGKVRAIQHLEGGIVKQIRIKEGQIVKKGDVLFQLENIRAESEMKEIQVALDALNIKRIRLRAELDLKDELIFPEHLMTEYRTICETEMQFFKSRKAEFYEKEQQLKKQMNQKVLKLDETESTIKNISKEMKNANQQLAIRKKLLKTGAISRSQYLETDSEVKNFNTRISKLKKEIPVIKSEISETLSQLEEIKQRWRYQISEELTTADVDTQKLDERIKSYNDAVERKDVISSLNGVIKKMHINTIGGVVQPGQVIAEVIPLQETLIVEANIATEDRGKIWVGLPVIAKITAYDYSVYGGVDGKLIYISADSFIDNQNRQFYQVRIELDKSEISKNRPLLPGMAVEINILANEISILNAILSPIRKIRDNAIREI